MVKYEVSSFAVCPFGRSIRAILNEKKISHKVRPIADYSHFEEFSFEILSPNLKISNSTAPILEYIEEEFKENQLLYGDTLQRLKIRQMISFVEERMYKNSTKFLLFEKIINRKSTPNSTKIQEGHKNLNASLKYLNEVLLYNSKIAGEYLSIADFILAAHISCLDYINAVNWSNDEFENLKSWYSAIKSRPSFKAILSPILPDFAPPSHYFNLDF